MATRKKRKAPVKRRASTRRIGMPQNQRMLVAGVKRRRSMGATKKAATTRILTNVGGVILGGALVALIVPKLPGKSMVKNVATVAAGVMVTYAAKKPLMQGIGIGIAAAGATGIIRNAGIMAGLDDMVSGVMMQSQVAPPTDMMLLPAATGFNMGAYTPVGFNYPGEYIPDYQPSAMAGI